MSKVLMAIGLIVAAVVVWKIVTTVVMLLLPLVLLAVAGLGALWMWKRWLNSKAPSRG